MDIIKQIPVINLQYLMYCTVYLIKVKDIIIIIKIQLKELINCTDLLHFFSYMFIMVLFLHHSFSFIAIVP